MRRRPQVGGGASDRGWNVVELKVEEYSRTETGQFFNQRRPMG